MLPVPMFARDLWEPQPTSDQPSDGTTSPISVKITKKRVSAALETVVNSCTIGLTTSLAGSLRKKKKVKENQPKTCQNTKSTRTKRICLSNVSFAGNLSNILSKPSKYHPFINKHFKTNHSDLGLFSFWFRTVLLHICIFYATYFDNKLYNCLSNGTFHLFCS